MPLTIDCDSITRMKKTITLKTEEDTKVLGRMIAKDIIPGDVVALTGDLGAGKTTLAKSIALALGINETIISPTYTIVAEYHSGNLPFYHFDVYRINEGDELFEIGLEEYINGNGVCVIEWADLIEKILPSNTKWFKLEYTMNENERICTIG